MESVRGGLVALQPTPVTSPHSHSRWHITLGKRERKEKEGRKNKREATFRHMSMRLSGKHECMTKSDRRTWCVMVPLLKNC